MLQFCKNCSFRTLFGQKRDHIGHAQNQVQNWCSGYDKNQSQAFKNFQEKLSKILTKL